MVNRVASETSKKIWLLIFVAIIVILGIIGGIYFWPQGFKEKAEVIKEIRSANLVERYQGYILLLGGDQNQAWYVYPGNKKRYYLGSSERGLQVMHRLERSVSSADLKNLPIADSGISGDSALQSRMSGYVLNESGRVWYISPQNQMRYYLNTEEDMTHLISRFGTAVSNADLKAIPLATSFPSKTSGTATQSTYEYKTISTKRGKFTIHLATLDLSSSNIEVITATAAKADCYNNCPAAALADFVKAHQGFAGIHGAYFCPPDYANCQSKINYYFYPFYETSTGFLVNAGEVKWLQGSILIFDQNNNYYFFVDGRDFVSMASFEKQYNTKIRALASNSPALISNGVNIVSSQKMDDKQRNTKGFRGGIGVKGKVVYLVIARAATVPDLASIMETLGVTTALNLDGGGSSALYWKGRYKVGPGRLLPTAIVFREK